MLNHTDTSIKLLLLLLLTYSVNYPLVNCGTSFCPGQQLFKVFRYVRTRDVSEVSKAGMPSQLSLFFACFTSTHTSKSMK